MKNYQCFFVLFLLPFSSHSFHYNETEARIYLRIAAASYGDKIEECMTEIFPSSTKWSLLYSHRQNCEGGQCAFVVLYNEEENSTVMAFKGTRGMDQFMESVTSVFFKKKVDFEGMGQVSSYFLESMNELWDEVVEMLEDERVKSSRLVIVGHSLGAAQAALTASRIVRKGLRNSEDIQVFVFAEPRIGDKQFVNNYDRILPNTARIVNRDDFISKFKWFGYEHHGTKIWYPNGMTLNGPDEYKICEEDEKCNRMITLPWRWKKDHSKYFGIYVVRHGKNGCSITHLTSRATTNIHFGFVYLFCFLLIMLNKFE